MSETNTAKNLYDMLAVGGVLMIPLAGLSVATMACALERACFWVNLYRREDKIAHQILDAAHYSLVDARLLAQKAKTQPIARFLLAPLKLNNPSPETFRLAMESAAEQEFIQMRKGDKLLETTIAVAPLLGLLGTVTGLMMTFANLNIGGGGGSESTSKAAAGIGEALTTTAGGMLVAMIALVIFRIGVTLQSWQMDYFGKIGNELELIYRQVWHEPALAEANRRATAAETNHADPAIATEVRA